jgi:hypothetical protein
MRVTEFVKNVGIDRRYLDDDDLGLLYLSLNVLKYYARAGFSSIRTTSNPEASAWRRMTSL